VSSTLSTEVSRQLMPSAIILISRLSVSLEVTKLESTFTTGFCLQKYPLVHQLTKSLGLANLARGCSATWVRRTTQSSCRIVGSRAQHGCLTILPAILANVNHTLNAITGAAFGAAGQRCMAISVAVLVGDAKEFLPGLVERASKLRINGGFEPNTDLCVFPSSALALLI
jgi:hypothetical protein